MDKYIMVTEEIHIQHIHNLDVNNMFSVKAFTKNNIEDGIGKSLKIVYKHIEIFDDSDNFFSFVYNAQKLVDVLNGKLFKTRNVDVLNELVQLKTECKSEPLVKMLALIGIIQEFFGASVAANWYTRSDLSGIMEGASSVERSFMNIHMIHFFYHKGYTKDGLFSIYGNADLNDGEKIEKSMEFASSVYSKLVEILENTMFDNLLVEFYKSVGAVKKISNEDVSHFVNYSVEHGTHAVNPIATRLEELGFAEVCT